MMPESASSASLGNNTKYSAAPLALDPSNDGASGPILGEKNGEKLRAARALRYQLQDTSRRLHLAAAGVTSDRPTLSDLNRARRVVKCRHVRVGTDVAVLQSLEHGTAHYGGLAVCGSVWACPVCAARIQERRRVEVCSAIESARAEGLHVSMLTLTFPHTRFDSCSDLLARQREALRLFRGQRRYREFRDRIGYVGIIRSLEVTHGANGWHPHTHELWFYSGSPRGMLSAFRSMWLDACSKAGLIPCGKLTAFRRHAVDFMQAASSGEYLAKMADQSYWGADSELVRGHTKIGRRGGRSPFALLADADSGDSEAGRLFIEFTDAFHGARQLYWSRGLKQRWGITDLSDEVLAADDDDRAMILGRLPPIAWHIVRLNRARAEVLDIAEKEGWPGLVRWFSDYGVILDSGG